MRPQCWYEFPGPVGFCPLAAQRKLEPQSQLQLQPQPQLWFHLHVGVLLESWPVGSGSDNHFRLDLAASVARLAGGWAISIQREQTRGRKIRSKKRKAH